MAKAKSGIQMSYNAYCKCGWYSNCHHLSSGDGRTGAWNDYRHHRERCEQNTTHFRRGPLLPDCCENCGLSHYDHDNSVCPKPK